jgi:hypothetical protein
MGTTPCSMVKMCQVNAGKGPALLIPFISRSPTL